MARQDPLPPQVEMTEPVRLCVTADLLPDGSFGTQWLIVTADDVSQTGTVHVYAAMNGGVPTERVRLALAEIESPKAETLVGGGVLEATHHEETVELVRYTNAHSARFGIVAKSLEAWAKGEEPKVEEEEERHCPRCGFPLQKGTRVCPACLPRSKALLRLVAYLRPHWKQAVGLSALALFGTALGLVPPYLNKPLMDQVLAPKGIPRPLPERLHLLAWVVIALLVARVLGAAVSAAQGWLAAWLGNRITHDIRCVLYEHLQRLALRFFDRQQVGTVVSRVNQDTSQLQSFLVWGSQDLATNVLLIVGIGIMLFFMDWQLALLVFIPAPFVGILSARFWRVIRGYMHRFFGRWSRLNSVLNETLNGLRIVRSFAQEPREVARFQNHSIDLAVTGTQAERAWSVLFAALSMLIMAGTLLVWYFGGRHVLFGRMTLGTLMAFLMYVSMFYGPVQSMSWLINWCSRSLTAAERVFEVLDSEPEVDTTDCAVAMPRIEGRIEFDHITFGYDRHKPVLKDIDLTIEPGQMVGLVGHSGAGKTTTINLICRFYQVDEGELRIDGVPINTIRLQDLRRQMGIVPQDTFLFSGTIAENISYAKPDATREEIIRAAKIANAHDFILRKPDGYETMVGEAGKGLSAGERQRLAIARAVLHDPRILILDEATSQVDVETESQIQEAISRLVRGRTTIAIAHRLSTLKNADRLVVLKDGAVVESGSHAELLEKEDGEFRKLVEKYQEVSSVRAVER